MQQLLQNPAVIGGLAGAIVVALTNLARGLYTLYMTRSRRTLEPALSLAISGDIEPREGSEDIVDCRLRVENVGDVRVMLRSAVLKVSPPLVEDEATGNWVRRLRWAEAEIFDAFDPEEVPGKVLNPRERYEEPAVLVLATRGAEKGRDPIQAQLRVIAEGDYYWSTMNTLVRVAEAQARYDNEGAERRR